MKARADDRGLLIIAAKRFGFGIFLLGAFLFLCAGSLRYWNAWLFLLTLSLAICIFGAYLFKNDKELLQKRLNADEKEKEQRGYVRLTALSFLGTFGVCGLDYRFGWSRVPLAAVAIALGTMLVGYGLFVITLLQNRFASRVIEIQQGQRVIDSGVYSVIRHPLYTAAIIMFFSSPIVLGSFYALLPMVCYPVAIMLRIKNEEKVLRKGLEGYAEYMTRVRYRLIPFIW